ncbi:circularly permuted type 2 ATP-grasp protein [Gellertiella hungarica]|uniref:Putative circularly permuted ATP-grasp superfamily protein/putative alpha-E superfamily protein n=1 Tax=Gellertiella hungarica TaxID=1572859 RepID=A0A7W6J300_9HYPH|nr:circularly permuted type 2 ATP-grasp protein [Gellertiella hungarica]MBB4063051.1 putative circularly permuted ATP-grasp superfamily protein/putative alpha-E superfamily protein [Gellertiella hungarica]
MAETSIATGGKTAEGALPFGYAPRPGTFDEMTAADGQVRTTWRPLLDAFGAGGLGEHGERFARAERYLRDAGIHHRDYGGSSAARPWPLSSFPVLLAESEWIAIADGLAERADLLEAVMADLYGKNRLVADGILPPLAVAGNPEWLRPLVGIAPRGGHFLHFLAFDLGRDRDGQWRILADRTQAPSAAGFALENRVATTRAVAGLFDRNAVHRLAPFFARFRDALQAGLADGDERVAVLTQGRQNPTYFEQAYLARYLGFTLLEGEDLTVIDGELMVRTIAGPRPVAVLWRRLAGTMADPLELDEGSMTGTPGLVEAVRAGSVTLVNALGSGILETGILAAHYPAIARHLLGRALSLPAARTMWGSGAEAPSSGSCLVGPAFGTLPPFEKNSGYRRGAWAEVADRPDRVAVDDLPLSRAPVLMQGELVARPLTIRAFAARTAEGWTVMPGGFARLADRDEDGALAFRDGGRSADLWIIGSKPVPAVSLLSDRTRQPILRQGGNLPGRAADNLFWLGRYIERAEGALRILRAYHARLAESGRADLPLLGSVTAYLAELDIDTAEAVPKMLVANIDSAVYSAGNIRDRFSPDGWMALTDLQKTVHRFRETVAAGDDAAHAMTILLRKLAGFAGLVHENMYRFMGWRFLTIGRHLERGLHMTLLLAHFTRPDAPEGSDDLILDIGDNVMTHRRHYSVDTSTASVIDLMGLDPYNPRSVLFQLGEITRSVVQLPDSAENRLKLRRDIAALEQDLAGCEPGSLDWRRFKRLEQELETFSDALALAYLT